MLLLVILAFIGLATTLRLQSYQLQKTLPALLLVALLINFSGLFVGFVVDAANLVINIFMKELTNFNAVINQLTAILKNTEQLFENLTDLLLKNPDQYVAGIIQPLANTIAVLIFTAIFALSLFVAMLLFVVRFGVLWILSILAPLAFAAAVLPATRKLWSQWLQQLLQWAFIGIPMIFFLYLAQFVAVGSHFAGISTGGFGEVIVALIEPLIVVLFIIVGFFLSMSFAPAGAQSVISFGQKWGTRAAMATGSAAMRHGWLGGGAQKLAVNLRRRGQGQDIKDEDKTLFEKMPGMGRLLGAIAKPSTREGYERTLQGYVSKQSRINELLGKEGSLTEEEGDELDRLQGETEGVDPAELRKKIEETPRTAGLGTITRVARWGTRTVAGGAEIGLKELTKRVEDKDVREFQEAMKEVGDIDSFMAFNMVKQELLKGRFANKNRILGLLNGVRERGDTDDIRDALTQGVLDKKIIGETIKTGLRVGPPGFRPLLKSFYGSIFTDPEEYGFNAKSDEHSKIIPGSGKDAGWLAKQDRRDGLSSKFNAKDMQGDTPDPNNWQLDSADPKIRKAAEKWANMLMEYRGADFMPQIARRERKQERDDFMQYVFKTGKFAGTDRGLGTDWLLQHGAYDVLRYITSTAARSAGVGAGFTQAQADSLIKAHQTSTAAIEELTQELTNLRAEKISGDTSQQRINVIDKRITTINEEMQWRREWREGSAEELEQEHKRTAESIDNLAKTQKETPNAFTPEMATQLAGLQGERRRFAAELARRRGATRTPGTPEAEAKEPPAHGPRGAGRRQR